MNENTETVVEETTLEETTLEDTTTIDDTTTEETTVAEETVTTDEAAVEETSVEGDSSSTEGDTETITEVILDAGEETTTSTEVADTPMSIPFIGLTVLQCVIALFLVIVVLQQSKSASNMMSSTLSGGSGENQSYWNKNKGRSKESKLARMTVILAVIFLVLTVVLGFIR